MAMYTAWIMIESDIATVSALTILFIRGMTAERAWKSSPSCRLWGVAMELGFFLMPMRRELVLGDDPLSVEASTKG
jgi:hypothetical protein